MEFMKKNVTLVVGISIPILMILFVAGGWPLALVVCGLAMIGVGYISVSLNRKYLR